MDSELVRVEPNLLETIALPVQLIPLVHEYLDGETIDDLAIKYNLEPTKISEFLNRKEVKTFINSKLKNHRYLSILKRVDLLSDAVEEKVKFAQENDMPLTNKDLLEILKLLREESKDLASQSGEIQSDEAKNTYVSIINQLKS